MKFITHDNHTVDSIEDAEDFDEIYNEWKFPETSYDRNVVWARVGKYGFIYNVSARAWIIEIDAHEDSPELSACSMMAFDRVRLCMSVWRLLCDVDNPYAREVLNSAKQELDEYNNLIQGR